MGDDATLLKAMKSKSSGPSSPKSGRVGPSDDPVIQLFAQADVVPPSPDAKSIRAQTYYAPLEQLPDFEGV